MRIAGKRLSSMNEITLVLPRSGLDEQGEPVEDIVLKFRPVKDFAEFEVLCPEPKAPMIHAVGEPHPRPDMEDPEYVNASRDYRIKKMNYIIFMSMLATPGLEYEIVRVNDPSTWNKFSEELDAAGFSPLEATRITDAAFRANSLSEEALEEARQRFLLGERAKAKATSQHQAAAPMST